MPRVRRQPPRDHARSPEHAARRTGVLLLLSPVGLRAWCVVPRARWRQASASAAFLRNAARQASAPARPRTEPGARGTAHRGSPAAVARRAWYPVLRGFVRGGASLRRARLLLSNAARPPSPPPPPSTPH